MREIDLWFTNDEIVDWSIHSESWIYEEAEDDGALEPQDPVYDPQFSNPNAHHL